MNEIVTAAQLEQTQGPNPDAPDWYKDAIIYQLHVKTFVDSNGDGVGDFAGLLSRLDYIQELGVTAIWLLPFYPSPLRDDGYDIADYRSVNPSYGNLEDVERLIEEAHKRGMRVITELVINHTSDQHPWFQAARHAPKGSPERDFYVWADDDKGYDLTRIIFTDTETSNWTWDPVAQQYFWHRFFSHQPDLNFDNPKVMEEVLSVMHFWLDKGVDGLRLDAIDSIKDTTDTPLVKELAAAVRERFPARHVHLTTEDDRNITWHIERGEAGKPLLVSGEWNDDVHHTVHVLATHEQEGYYEDYLKASVSQLARALATGFVFQGDYSAHRDKKVGVSSEHLPPTAFVNFIQNHDQIGNRAFGERLTDLASRRMVECAQAILLLSPQIPLMFMGEEWGETHPFCFFTDFDGELGEAVSNGRRAEFAKFAAFRDEHSRDLIPDPNSLSTFEASSLDWSVLARPNHRRRLEQVRRLLTIRQDVIVPLLADIPPGCGSYHVADGSLAFSVAWTLKDGQVLHLFANLDDEPWPLPSSLTSTDLTGGHLVHAYPAEADKALAEGSLPGTSVVFRLAHQSLIAGAVA